MLAHFFAAKPQKNRAIRSNLLAAPKGFPLLSLVPHGLFALRATHFYIVLVSAVALGYRRLLFSIALIILARVFGAGVPKRRAFFS
jgi:hypothetical protein